MGLTGSDSEPHSSEASARERSDLTVTLQCNNHCRFCPRPALRHISVRSREDLDARLRAIRAHSRRVLLTGGELTVLDDAAALVARCRALGFEQIATITNGRRLADMARARALIDAGLTEACVSVYHLDETVHDDLTLAPGSLRETLAGLDNLLALAPQQPQLCVRVNTVLCADNATGMVGLVEDLAGRGVSGFLIAEVIASEAFGRHVPYAQVLTIARQLAASPLAGAAELLWRGFPLCIFQDLSEISAEPHDVDTMLADDGEAGVYFADFFDRFTHVEACARCRERPRCPGIQKRYLERHDDAHITAIDAAKALPAIEAARRELAPFPPWPEPHRLEVMPTTACPFRCRYCAVTLSGRHAAPEVLDRAVDLLLTSAHPRLELQFFGGEPLLRRGEVLRTMKRSVAQAARLGKQLRFVITTSGLLLDEEMLRRLSHYEVSVLFSLDGPAAVMERDRPLHRNGTDYPVKVIEQNLTRLLRSGLDHFVNVVIAPEAAGEALERVRYLADLGVRTAQLCYTLGPGWDEPSQQRFLQGLRDIGAWLGAPQAPPLRLQNFGSTSEPIILGNDMMVDVDGTLYGDGALFGEKVFPGLRQAYRIGSVFELERFDGLRRSREENLVTLRRCYPDSASPPRRMLERELAFGHRVQQALEEIVTSWPALTRPRQPAASAEAAAATSRRPYQARRHTSSTTVVPNAAADGHQRDRNPLQQAVLRRSLAHQARFAARHPAVLPLPLLMLHNDCYHDCLFCLSKPMAPTPLDTVRSWLEDNRTLGLKRLGIAGNEPLAHPEIDAILAAARSVGFERFEVLSSAVPLADHTRAAALLAVGVNSYAVPLYAADAVTHDAVTQSPGSHAATVTAIEHLRELGASVHVHANLIRQNLDQLAALETLVHQRWQLPLCIIPTRPKAANLSYAELVPRYREIIARARVSCLVAWPLCIAEQLQTPAVPDASIIADVLKIYVLDQPFIKPPRCDGCSLRARCSGTFAAYLEHYGDSEIEPQHR